MKMKLPFSLLLVGVCASAVTSQGILSRDGPLFKRFTNLFSGWRSKGPSSQHQHSQPYNPSAGLYGPGADYLSGAASYMQPMYSQAGVGSFGGGSPGDYVFPGISSAQSGPFAYGNYGSPNGNVAPGSGGPRGQHHQEQQQQHSSGANHHHAQHQHQYQPQHHHQHQSQHQPQQQQFWSGGENPALYQGESSQFQQGQFQQGQFQQDHSQHQGQHQPDFQQQANFQGPNGEQQQAQEYLYQAANQQGPYQQGQFQSDESANAAVSYEKPDQSVSPSLAADQDGVYGANGQYPQFAQQQQQGNNQQGLGPAYAMADSAPNQQAFPAPFAGAASHMRPQYAQYPSGDPNQFSARPYGSNPGTIDVHQVFDQFIRSTGLSPQGDHGSVKGDMAYAGSEHKPVLSVKKLISYPFYFSSSGDKPTSYGNNPHRRQSTDDSMYEVIYNTALKQNILASQKLEQPAAAPATAVRGVSKPSSAAVVAAPAAAAPVYSQPAPSDESAFISQHAQALQEFLKTQSSSSSSDATKDNKLTSSSSSGVKA